MYDITSNSNISPEINVHNLLPIRMPLSISVLTRGLLRDTTVKTCYHHHYYYYYHHHYEPQCIFHTVSMLHFNFSTRATVIQSVAPQQMRIQHCAFISVNMLEEGVGGHISNAVLNMIINSAEIHVQIGHESKTTLRK